MKLNPLTIIALIISYQSAYAQIQIGLDIDSEASGDQCGGAVSMPNATTIAIGAHQNDGSGSDAGHVRVLELYNGEWEQKGTDIDGEVAGDYSGQSVCMPDVNTVAIGARLNDGNGANSGHVRVFEWNGSTWFQKGTDIDGEMTNDYSGLKISMPDANTLAIGASSNDGNGANSGHVRVYEWNGSAWVQKGIDIDGEAAGDMSGSSVDMPDANTVAIGAVQNDGIGLNAGHVRMYEWSGSTWVQKGADIEGEAAEDNSGQAVSMPDANTVAIGANNNDGNGIDAGHVRVFEWNGSAWVQKGMDIDGETASDQAGFSVSMPDANTVAIGAPVNNGNGTYAGHVRVHEWNGSSWVQNGMDIDGESASDQSGFSVSMPDASTLAVGAPVNDGNGSWAGHARVFKLKGVAGVVYNDLNQNCIHEELGVVDGLLG